MTTGRRSPGQDGTAARRAVDTAAESPVDPATPQDGSDSGSSDATRTGRAGSSAAGPDQSEPAAAGAEPVGDLQDAASSALARARAAAAAKGLRPGMRPARRRPRREETPYTGPGTDARDPVLLGEQLGRMLSERGWQVDLAAGSLMARWPDIVGPELAGHARPETFENGVLTIRASSTAWATQLKLLSPTLLGRLAEEVGPDVVTEIAVIGPTAPSWRKGLRRAPGPGPRDTYG